MEQEKKSSHWHERTQKFIQGIAQSNKVSMIMYAIGILLVVIIIFQAGMIVGSRKDSLIHEQNGRYPDISRPLPNAHGTTGRIIAVSFPTLLVADQDHTEKVVLIKPETIIRSSRDSLIQTQLEPGDMIVVIGTPNTRGYIQANFIRVLQKN